MATELAHATGIDQGQLEPEPEATAGGAPSGRRARGRLRGAFAPLLGARGIPRWLLLTGGAITFAFTVLAVFASTIAPSIAMPSSAHVGKRFSMSNAIARRTTLVMHWGTDGGRGIGGRPDVSRCSVASWFSASNGNRPESR